MKDSEIALAFEKCIGNDFSKCEGCPYSYSGEHPDCDLIEYDISNLVSRLMVENEFLKATKDLNQAEFNEVKAELEFKKAEIDRLNIELGIEQTRRTNAVNAYHELADKAIELKMFWEKVRGFALVKGCYQIVEFGDDLIHEIGGEKS